MLVPDAVERHSAAQQTTGDPWTEEEERRARDVSHPEHLLISSPPVQSYRRTYLLRSDAVVVIFFAGVFGFARSFRCSSIFRRGTPFFIQSGAGAPFR